MALASGRAHAQGAHVDNRCPALSATEYDELDARVQLLLKSEGPERPPPAVVCGPDGAWVEWDGSRFELSGKAPLPDEVVEVVQAALQRRRAAAAAASPAASAVTAPASPEASTGGASAAPDSGAGHRADPLAQRSSDARGGGIALGVEGERCSDALSYCLGPTFDVGVSLGPLLFGGRESFRFSTRGRQVSLMDFEGGIAYGAPFNPDALFGLAARFGAEWMVVYPQGNASQATAAPMGDLGLRIASKTGQIRLWAGVDLHVRLARLTLQGRGPSDVSGSLTLGTAFVDWSRK